MKKTFVIAEAGVNHNGSITLAKRLVDVAVEARVDAVKFQTFKSENLVTKNAEKASYQMVNTNKKEQSQHDMLKALELSYSEFITLKEYCEEKNILFMSTPFDLDSIDFLYGIGQEIFKIPSGEIDNVPYLREIGKLKKKVIFSTGMSDNDEIAFCLNTLRNAGSEDITILHCNSDYPTVMKDVNLLAMNDIRNRFAVDVGYSDHTLGIEVPICAVALGANVIEKHFTLDKNMEGPDHKASLSPIELKDMVKAIRNIELALGDGNKNVTDSAKNISKVARKSIVSKVEIKKGEIFTGDNLTIKRPAGGISPKQWDNVVGKKADRDYMPDEMIML